MLDRLINGVGLLVLVLSLSMTMLCSCGGSHNSDKFTKVASSMQIDTEVVEIITGAERIALYYPKLRGKKVALVVNQTSIVGDRHLVDTLLKMNVDVIKIFAPEHGFRGEADAGQHIDDQVDATTGIPIVSLYGSKKGPSQEDLEGIDILVFDIQDVGVRFYTYISTLHYVMQACADQRIPLVLLDRPNPNGGYIDGPILEKEYQSFVGMHPVPIVYGMTIGEYGTMINGEQWLDNGAQCELEVIPCKNYMHNSYYNLPVKPSPNLPNIQSIFLYPSLCLFEGTTVSVGRGTNMPFQMFGHPAWTNTDHKIMPRSMAGAKYPKHENVSIGYSPLKYETKQELHERRSLNMHYLVTMYNILTQANEKFFLDNKFFEKLAGTGILRKQLESGMSATEIRDSWKEGIKEFEQVRIKYLLY